MVFACKHQLTDHYGDEKFLIYSLSQELRTVAKGSTYHCMQVWVWEGGSQLGESVEQQLKVLAEVRNKGCNLFHNLHR